MTGTEELLQSWLRLATDRNNQADRWDCVQGFYQVVNWMTYGPQVALHLLGDKIKSPNEREALQALNVLQACVDNCGTRFQSKATSFPFVNELVKIIEPKDAPEFPQKVRDKVVEILYRWRLKEDFGIEAIYTKLKAQGVIEKDPVLADVMPASLPARNCIFDRESKSELLEKLLKSERPEDWEEANKLIQSTVQKDQEKKEKRQLIVMQAKSSAAQLRHVCAQDVPAAVIKDLYETCKQLLPSLQSLVSDVDDEEGLAEVLAANDELTLVLSCYKEQLERSGREGGPRTPREMKSYHLIDLSALDSEDQDTDSPRSLADGAKNQGDAVCHSQVGHSPGKQRSHLEDLIQLNDAVELWSTRDCEERGPVLRSRGCGPGFSANGTSSKFLNPACSGPAEISSVPRLPDHCPVSLQNIFVKIETIRYSQLEPVKLFHQGGIHTSLHFTKDSPAGHPHVAVAVICTVNTSSLHVEDFNFKAAVPMAMAMKLQPPSATNLLPYNPLLPPASISQILLLANPHACTVRLHYELTMTHGHVPMNETGEVHKFPDWSAWVGH